jgi:hypothetical protein
MSVLIKETFRNLWWTMWIYLAPFSVGHQLLWSMGLIQFKMFTESTSVTLPADFIFFLFSFSLYFRSIGKSLYSWGMKSGYFKCSSRLRCSVSLGMAIQVWVSDNRRVPDLMDTGMCMIFYSWVAPVPNLNWDGYRTNIFFHPWVTWRVPDTLLPL